MAKVGADGDSRTRDLRTGHPTCGVDMTKGADLCITPAAPLPPCGYLCRELSLVLRERGENRESRENRERLRRREGRRSVAHATATSGKADRKEETRVGRPANDAHHVSPDTPPRHSAEMRKIDRGIIGTSRRSPGVVSSLPFFSSPSMADGLDSNHHAQIVFRTPSCAVPVRTRPRNRIRLVLHVHLLSRRNAAARVGQCGDGRQSGCLRPR